MTLKSAIALCGSLLSIVILISSQYQPVLGQDEGSPTFIHSETVISIEETAGEEAVPDRDLDTCPCILRSECPRIYGSNPLDFSEIGHVEPCSGDGFVRCCGVSVSIVQQSDESPPAIEDVAEESTWESESGHEQLEPSSDQNPSNKNDSKDDLHESQGQVEDHDEELNEQEETLHEDGDENTEEKSDENTAGESKSSEDDEELEEDHIPAESREDAQTVMVDPRGLSPRKRLLRKFHRLGRPAADSDDDSQQPSLSTETGNEDGLGEGGNRLHPYNSPSPVDNSGSVVYSQRVSDYPAYRSRNKNAPIADSDSNDLHKFNKDSANLDNGESSPSNVENRPKYPIRRRRPINQMRIRAQTHHQQDDVEEQAENNGVSGASSSSSEPNSPPAPVHVSIQTADEGTQDELGNERRPMSRLVKPRVSALHRRRKRPGSPGTSGEQSESLHSDNSDGSAPSSDNGSYKEKLPHDLKQQELITEMETDNGSSATIGSEDGGSEPLTSAQKLYQNSPSGKLVPFRPKIRSFSRKNPNHMMKADGDTAPVSSDSTNENINQNEGQQEVDPDTDAKAVQRTQTRPNGVTIRKVPIRRVKPNIPETNNDSQNEMNAEEIPEAPTSPVKGRPIMRRPINSASLLKNNKQASLADYERHLEESQSPAEPQEQAGIKIEKLDVRERFRGRHRNNPLKASTSAPSMETTSNEESSQDHHENMDNPGENLSSSLDTTSSAAPARPMLLRKRIRPLRRPSALEQGHSSLSDGENEGKLAENNGADNGNALTSDANPGSSSVDGESEGKQTAEIPRVKIRIGGIHPRFPSQRRGQQQQQQETPSDSSPSITSSQEESSDADNTEHSNALRQRQRLTSNRGKLRRPQSTDIISATSESGTSDMSATSETPVTVTSSYSRLRVNSKSGFPLRPVFRRVNSVKPSEENEPATVTPESTSTIKDAHANQENAFGTRTRFAVQSRFPAIKSDTQTEVQLQPVPSDKDEEKQGQLSQLNETPEDNSSHVQEKRVGFGKRKRVRVRVRPQHDNAQEQQEEKVQTNNGEHPEEQQKQQGEEGSQQQLLPNQEKKHGAYEEAGRNPETQNSEHVGPDDNVTFHSPGISVALNSNQEPEEQSPSSGNHPTDQVKIVPVGELPSQTEHTAVGNEHAGQEGNDDSKQHYDDDGQRDTENYHHPTAAELDSDAYDLILNQDVRKTLGTQGTHSTHYSALSQAYKVGGEEDDGDDDGSPLYHSTSPSYHHLNQEHNQHPSEDTYYDQYNHYSIEDHQRENTHSETGHKYSSHDSSKPAYSSNGIQRETDDMGNIETLELGTPEYDDAHQMNYNDWHSYEDDLDEDEEESRVQENYLTDNKSGHNKSSLAVKGRVRFNKHSLRVQKGNRDSSNEGKPVDTSYNKKGEEVGPSTSHTPVNPLSGGASYTSESESSTTTATHSRPSSNDVSEDIKRERNKRIRQKLRRPPTAYINNSEGSTFNNQESSGGGATSAPFTPSIPSPRPTYSGHAALLESVNQSVLSLPKSESLSNYPDSKPLEQFIQNKQLAPERRNRTRVRVKLVTLPTTTPAPTYVANNDNYNDNNGNENDAAAPDASYMEERPRRPSHSGFTFPPFKKSNLELVPSTEAPSQEPATVSYTPQQVIFDSTPTTTTTASPPPTSRRPFKTIMNNYNKASHSPGQASTGPAGSSGGSSVQMTRHNLTSNANKYGTRHRFKVSELKSVTPSSSIVDSPSPSSSSTPTNEHIETVRKPQIRLRAPEYRRKIPTTPAPIRHYQVSSTSPPPIYSSNENQSPPRQEEVMIREPIPQQPPPALPIPTNEKYNSRPASLPSSPPSAYKEEEQGSISIRITSQPNDAIDHDTVMVEKEADQQSQYVPAIVRQPENAEPNYISHLPPVPVNKNVGKETSGTYSSNGGTVYNQKGKYNSRFKVPEKFHQQKPNTSLGNIQGNNLVQPPPPHHIDLEPERELPINVVETEGNFKTKYAYDNEVSMNVEPIPYPNPPQAQQIQLQSYDDNRPVNMYQNAVDVDMNLNAHHERKPVLHHVPNNFEELQPTEPEFIPDIRINVHPVTPMHNEGERAPHNDNMYHAVRERPTPPPQRHPSLTPPPKMLKHSQFGPFPSTDHWSGIPSANSPKLPEFFEQNKQTSHPIQSSEMPSEFDTDLRLLTTMEPRPARPPMVRFPEHGHQNVHFNENKENLSLPPPPPVETTLVQFGTDFDGEEEEEEVEHHRRPINFNDNLNLHGNQLHKQPMEFSVLNGNQDSRIPLGPPQHHPANFPNRPIPTVVIPPQSSVVVPLPAPQLIPAHNVQFMRPHVPHNNMQHQSNAPHFPQNEHPQFHSKPGLPAQQEPTMRLRPNPIPLRSMSHEMKDGEFPKPHFALPHPDGATKDLHRPQPHPQFSQNHQPNGNNLRANEPQPHPPHHPKQHHPIMPPQHHQHPPNSGETFLKAERPQPIVLKTSNLNSHNAPHPHRPLHNPDGRHPDAPVRNVVRQPSPVTFEKPLERPTGNIVFEKEPEKKPINGPSLANNFPPHPMPNTRDPLQRPMQPPKSQIKFPESASQGSGGQQAGPPRPGQFGPPPPSQLRLPQYVPFGMGQDRPLRNDSGKQVHDSQARPAPPIHHPQGLQQSGKFGGGQFYPPFSHPPRQHPNGNFASPPQQFPPHRPQPQVMMPGFPKGPLPTNNNPYFQQRFRNPNARTSRAANLTAEEEKAKTTAESIQRSFQTAEEKAMEMDSQSDQQALFLIQNLERSSEEGPSQLLVSDTESGTPNSEDKNSEKVAQFPAAPEYMLNQELIPTSNENSESSSLRQERELKLEELLEGLEQEEGNKERLDVLSGEENLQNPDEISLEILQPGNFVQDLLPDEILESAETQGMLISHPYQPISTSPANLESDKEITQRTEMSEDTLKPSKQKNIWGHKGKLNGNEGEKRLSLLKSSDFSTPPSQDKLATLTEIKKNGIMKIKGVKGKSEQQQQQYLAKFKDASKSEKKQAQKSSEVENNNEIKEQQEFVAPKVIQRGFHPILPYSEKDPGPVVVQMLPKMEKLLPPGMDLKEGGGSNNNNNGNRLEGQSGITSPLMMSSNGNPSIVGAFGLNAFRSFQEPNMFANKPMNQIPSGVQTNHILNTYP